MALTLVHAILAIPSPLMTSTAKVSYYCLPRTCLMMLLVALDVDECALGTALCTHNCQDTYGSYTCSCRPGYRLSTDGFTCVGMSMEKCLWHHYYCICDCNVKRCGWMLSGDRFVPTWLHKHCWQLHVQLQHWLYPQQWRPDMWWWVITRNNSNMLIASSTII